MNLQQIYPQLAKVNGFSSATSIVGYTIDNLFHKVLYAIQQELDIFGDLPRQIESLQDELRGKHCACMSTRSDWVGHVRKMVHDAEDLIDESFLLFREKQMEKTGTYLIHQKYKLWCDRRRIKREIESLKVQVINHIVQSSDHSLHKVAPQSAPYRPPKEIVGLDDEANVLVKKLLDEKEKALSVVSIVGMGGIGKSTLAWKVYNHPTIQKKYKKRVWTPITECFDYRDVLVSILSDISQEEKNDLRKSKTKMLENQFNKCLCQGRYMIVLDDVWSPPGHSAWERLLSAFHESDRWYNCRIIITTRMNDVAQSADTRRNPFRMKYLGDDESWELFSKEACIGNDDIEFQDIGKQIVRRCAGLPLSIVAMARRFTTVNRRRADWDKECEEMGHGSKQTEIYDCLERSYNALMPELKYCFLHIGLFPENCTISTRKLTLIWIAEDLIIEQEGERAEDVAMRHLDTLVQRNMIHPIEICSDGRMKTFKIDNSLRQLCIIKAKEEIMLEIQGECEFQPSSQCCRHLAIHCSKDRYFDSQDSKCPLRTLMSFLPGAVFPFGHLVLICKRFKLLKVLHLEGMIVDHIPNEVGELWNLRYMNLRGTRIDQLPKSMENLKKLLTLDIRDNTYLRDLKVLQNMKILRNLYLPGFGEEFELSNLTQLEALKRVKLVSDKCLESLAKLTALRTLQVQLGGAPSNLNYFFNSAKELKHLESLYFYPEIGISSLEPGKFQWLSSLTKLYIKGGVRKLPSPEDFPPNLTQLTLDGSGLTPFPLGKLGELQKLLILRLRNLYIKGEKLSFPTNGFPTLEYLELLTLWNLKDFELQGKDALKRLKHLKISNCTALNGLPMENLTSLSSLRIDRMREKFEKKIQKDTSNKPLQEVIEFTNTMKDHESM